MVYDLAGQQLLSGLNPYSAYAKANQQANLANEVAMAELAIRQQQAMQGSEDPAAVREYQYFSQLSPEQQKQYLSVKRAQQTLDLGGYYGGVDPTTMQVNPLAGGVKTLAPEQMPQTKFEQQTAAAEGKLLGEKKQLLGSMESKLPTLVDTVNQLKALGQKATYTTVGQAKDIAARQFGMTTEGAKARSEYNKLVDTTVLPLLRDTFGAAFTKAEGDSLRETLAGDGYTPEEKSAILDNFILQKQREVSSLQRELSNYGDGMGEIVLTPDVSFGDGMGNAPTLAEKSKANFKGKTTGALNFKSEAAAEAAMLPSGTVVTINGRKAVIE